MSDLIKQNFALYFPIFFATMWFFVTTLLGFLSGWFALMKAYPNSAEEALKTLTWQSGSMNTVSMRSILTLGVCPSGLRIGMMRLFGPFCRPFLVPWAEISVVRKDYFLWKMARLSFGEPPFGRLTVSAHVADRLAIAAEGTWPEPGPFVPETRKQTTSRVAKLLVGMALIYAALFAVAIFLIPRFMHSNMAGTPIRRDFNSGFDVLMLVAFLFYLRGRR